MEQLIEQEPLFRPPSSNSTQEEIGFVESIYYCESTEKCMIKYTCGGLSLVFMILYAIAVNRMRRKKTLEIDVKDQILLCLALSEAVIILVYHIFMTHLIFLFLLRVGKMLEQVTITLILVELSVKGLNLKRAFLLSVLGCIIAIAVVIVLLLIEGSYDILHE
jgi:hypothetical protein